MRSSITVLAAAALLAATSCTIAEGADPDFDRDFVDDFENDDDEAAAEGEEVGALDAIDDLDDVEDAPPFSASGDDGEPPADGGATGALASTAKRHGPHGPLSVIQDDANFSGRGFLDAGVKVYDPAKAGERLDQAKALGADVVRVMVWWRDVVPGDPHATTKPKFVSSKPDDYDWRVFDAQVSAARARGLKVLVTIPAGPMPYWASEDPAFCVKKGGWSCAYKPKYAEYAAWVAAMGRHVKQKGYRIWAWTFVNEPNLGAFLADDSGLRAAHRYRKLWFHARKALRKTAGVKARVLFGDLANNQSQFAPTADRWRFFNQALCLELDRDPEVIPGFCPDKKRRVEASGVAFHPYASTPLGAKKSVDFLEQLADAASAAGRLPKNRGLYMTESAFLTARAADAGKLGAAAMSVSAAQQAVSMNVADHWLSSNPRVKSLAQYELVDEGRGTWDCGLRYALGRVTLRSGEVVTGDFLEVRLGDHLTVQPAAAAPRTIAWADIAGADAGAPQFGAIDQGSPKPAYAAYRLAIDVRRVGADVRIWGLARADTGAGFSVEALTPAGWLEAKLVKTDELGFGSTTLPIGSATAWRLRFGPDVSREAR